MHKPQSHIVAIAILSVAFVVPAGAQTFIDQGHYDLEFAYKATGWEGEIHDHSNDLDLNPADTVLRANAGAMVTRPSGSQWDFTGVGAGQSFWVLPQFQNPSLLYLGVATKNETTQTFDSYFEPDPRVNTTARWVNVALTSVTRREGPGGVFSIWATDGFGNPVVWMSSQDGIGATDRLILPMGSHLHYNYGMSIQGTYDVTVVASGRIGGQTITSAPVTYTFQAVPEPATMLALAAGLAALAMRRRRA